MKTRIKYLFTALSLLAVGLTSCGQNDNDKKYDNSAVKGVELDTTYIQMNIGDSLQLTPTISWRDKEVEVYKEWRSSKSTVATVDETGFVTAVGSGKAYITYRAGNKMGSCTIYVPGQEEQPAPVEPEDPNAFKIGLDYTSRTLAIGESFILNATPTEVVDVTWEVDNSGVYSLTVDPVEKNRVTITGLIAGNGKVIATANGVSASCNIFVSDGEPVDPEDPESRPDGQDFEIFMYLDYNNVDEKDETGTKLLKHFWWFSNSPLDQSGKVPTVTNDMAADPAFPYFIGWSMHPIIDTKNDLWDLNKDVVGTTAYIYIFYGIWSDTPTMAK